MAAEFGQRQGTAPVCLTNVDPFPEQPRLLPQERLQQRGGFGVPREAGFRLLLPSQEARKIDATDRQLRAELCYCGKVPDELFLDLQRTAVFLLGFRRLTRGLEHEAEVMVSAGKFHAVL